MNSMIELEAEVIAAIESGKKIDAIKKLREIRGLGLKEAKELVDLYSSQNRTQDSSSTSSHPDASSGAGAKIGFIMVFGAICYFVYKFAL
ncbi:MAG: ribosomal protein L7/L12 [Pseudomonadales bacterium]|nr:ribosomal protein L7/L12 [Pseudomonadales bacterium]